LGTLTVCLAIVAPAAAQTVWHVDDDACPSIGTGTELDPFCSIQSAIGAAAATGDEIGVAPGTYYEAIDFLGKGIYLHSTHGRDVTRIDATDLGTSVVTMDRSYESGATLQGFTITGGTGTICWEPDWTCGGGIYIRSAGSVVDCIVEHNTAGDGAGVFVEHKGASFLRCVFRDNVATVGGAMLIHEDAISITDCTFERNSAVSAGAVHTYSVTPGEGFQLFSHCDFVANEASRAGGAIGAYNSSYVIVGCTFTRNVAGSGGACEALHSYLRMYGCSFHGNVARAFGGGVYSGWPSVQLLDSCTFVGNAADSGGSAVYCQDGSYVNIVGSTFRANASAAAGTIMSNGGEPSLAGNVTIESCIIRNGGNEFRILPSSGLAVTYSDVEGGFPGDGNFDLAPGFMRAPSDGGDGWADDPTTSLTDESANNDYGDLHLLATSPCINTGNPTRRYHWSRSDADGHRRVLCGRVDMGGYEFGIGDYDCDQSVNLGDFAQWEACLTAPGGGPIATGCEAFDFDNDNDVDLEDFGGFASEIIGL